MSEYLRLVSNAVGATPLVLVNGPPFTPWVLVGVDLGNPVWQNQFSGARGTQGRRASGGQPDDRQATFGLLSQDHADKDELAASLSALAEVIDEMRRYGGRITFREHNQTRRQHLDVMAAGASIATWDSQEYQLRDAARPAIVATCAPYLLWDPYDHDDDFLTDDVNAGDLAYTADAGAPTNLAVSGGQLNASANLTTENRLIHTGAGYTLGDHEAQISFSPGATITSLKAGVILKRIDASNYLEVYADDDSANSRLRIDKVVAGIRTNLATTNLAPRLISSIPYAVRGRIEQNVVYADHKIAREMQFSEAAGSASLSVALTSAEISLFGIGAAGRAGMVFTPQHASAFIDRFTVRPWTYRQNDGGSANLASVLRARGSIPGDAPAVCDLWINHPGSTANPMAFGLVGWAPATNYNVVQNGGFEAFPSTAEPWNTAAVAGVTGAATSVAVSSIPKFGAQSGLITTPATANVGANYPLYRRFLAGVTYTARAWLRSAASTTLARIRLGVSGDIASSTALALSQTWTLHTITWTPTANVSLAYLAVEQTAATAGSIQIDGAAVYEGTTAPSHGSHIRGDGAHPPLAVITGADKLSATAALTVAADASAKSGYVLRDTSVSAGGENYGAYYSLDPSLIGPDDYSGDEVSVEVWGRFYLHTAFTGGMTFTLQLVDQQSVALAYTSEYGSAGKSVPVVTSTGYKTIRLGTLTMGTAGSALWRMYLAMAVAAGTNLQQFGLDCLYVLPSRSLASSPSGKQFDGYPYLLPSAGASTKIIRSADLSGALITPPSDAILNRAAGLGGAPIELPPGDVDFFVVTNQQPAEYTGGGSDTTTDQPPIHLAVTPRSHWPRGA